MQLKEQQKEMERQKEKILSEHKKIEKMKSDFAQEKDIFSYMYTKLQKKEYILENAANSKEFLQSSRNNLPMTKESKKKVEVVDESDEETIASEHTHFNDKTLIVDDPCIVDESVSSNKQKRNNNNGKFIR